jgi:hypothetical protein
MASKNQILELIVRTAKENGGVPLGSNRFQSETGIREVDWLGRYWARWNDALKEAGFAPNSFQQAYSEEFIMENLAALARAWTLSNKNRDPAKDPIGQILSTREDISKVGKQS